MAVPVFAPDGQRLAVQRCRRSSTVTICRIELRSPADGSVLSGFDTADDSYSLAGWSPDGRFVVTIGSRLVIWEAATGKIVAEHAARTRNRFTAIRFHPTAPFLLAALYDGTVRVYSTDAWREAQSFAWGIKKAMSVAVAPDGMRAAVGGDGGRIVVWDWDLG
jgi:WD40 repeat protein